MAGFNSAVVGGVVGLALGVFGLVGVAVWKTNIDTVAQAEALEDFKANQTKADKAVAVAAEDIVNLDQLIVKKTAEYQKTVQDINGWDRQYQENQEPINQDQLNRRGQATANGASERVHLQTVTKELATLESRRGELAKKLADLEAEKKALTYKAPRISDKPRVKLIDDLLTPLMLLVSAVSAGVLGGAVREAVRGGYSPAKALLGGVVGGAVTFGIGAPSALGLLIPKEDLTPTMDHLCLYIATGLFLGLLATEVFRSWRRSGGKHDDDMGSSAVPSVA